MEALFAISIAALVAVLCAGLSTAKHVRRVRRQQKLGMEQADPTTTVQLTKTLLLNNAEAVYTPSRGGTSLTQEQVSEVISGTEQDGFPGFPGPVKSLYFHPLSRFTKSRNQEWVCNSQNLGDLSDPYETPRKLYKLNVTTDGSRGQ